MKAILKILLLFVLCVLSAAVSPAQSKQKGPSQPPRVAITIDDMDVNGKDTPKLTLDQQNAALLAALRAHGKLKAAIFVCGMRVDNSEGRKRLQAWNDDKHIIANHSYSHLYYPRVDFEKYSADILRGEDVIKGFSQFRKLFRFPYLKEGDTFEKRDKVRSFLKDHRYEMGYVTIDTSEWAIDDRLRKRLHANPNANLTAYRAFYLEHIWQRAVYYDDLAKKVAGRSISHTLLVHHNLVTSLFLDDLLKMFKKKGWKLVDAEKAYKDQIFAAMPNVVPAGESIIWSLAKESKRFNDSLRYPAEDSRYEKERMDQLGL